MYDMSITSVLAGVSGSDALIRDFTDIPINFRYVPITDTNPIFIDLLVSDSFNENQ